MIVMPSSLIFTTPSARDNIMIRCYNIHIADILLWYATIGYDFIIRGKAKRFNSFFATLFFNVQQGVTQDTNSPWIIKGKYDTLDFGF